MPGYVNDVQRYPLEFIFRFSAQHKVPVVRVEMEPFGYPGGKRRLVLGTMDTGSQRTVLDFNTAYSLGIINPEKDYKGARLKPHICYTATGKLVEYYEHLIQVYIKNGQGQNFNFFLCLGFAKKLKSNSFGMDWTIPFCLAFDCQTVHLLRP